MDSDDTNYLFTPGVGSVWMEGIDFEQGETREIGVMFDWTNDKVVKDWSLTAWGEQSKP